MLNFEFFTIYINLLKSVMGTGLLAYPFYIREYGMFSVILISAVSCLFSTAGLIFYAYSNAMVGKNRNMTSIAHRIHPKLSHIVSMCISLKCFLVSVLYFKIINELIEIQLLYITMYIKGVFVIRNEITFILFLITVPLSCIEKITKLKFTSFIGIIAIITVLISNSYTFYLSQTTNNIKWSGSNHIYYPKLGSIVYGFTCHQNIFSVQNEMKNKSLKFLTKIIVVTMLSAFSIYIYFGYINYKIFGINVEPTILSNYEHDMDFQNFMVTFFFSFMLLISIPLQVHPCRLYALNMINKDLNSSRKVRFIATAIILLFIYVIGSSDLEVVKIYTYIGGTVSCFICFVFGSVFYLKLYKWNSGMAFFAVITIVFGVYVFSSFLFVIYKMIFK